MPTLLYFIDGPDPLTDPVITIREGESLQIGRMPPSELLIRDKRVSSKHLTIDVSLEATTILDHNSRNGTLVNGEKISQAELHDGDAIQIGRTRFRVAMNGCEISPTDQYVPTDASNNTGTFLDDSTASHATRPTVVHLLTSDESDDELRFRFGQTVIIGSSRNASDFAFKNVGLDRRHFRLKCRNGRYFIKATPESSHRTLVNGKEFIEEELSDGDTISAGQIQFVFSLRDHQSKRRPTLGAPIIKTVKQAEPTPTAPIIRCELDADPTGLFFLDGKHDVLDVASLLSKHSKLMVLIDFLRSGVPHQETAVRISDESVSPFGSYLIELESPEQQTAMIEAAWNRDALVVLFSQLSLQELADRLIQIRDRNRNTFNLVWPSTTRGLLGWAPPGFFDALYQCVDTMMLETEAMEGWRICLKADNLNEFKQMGFQCASPGGSVPAANNTTT